MKRDDNLLIDSHRLRDAIDRRAIKHVVLASEIGVTPRSVSRWVSGEVQRISRPNAIALSSALECSIDDITEGPAPVLATRREQQRAARALQERDLLLLLSPSDNWELAERLIRATMEPNLPLDDLGRLYNLLSIASWRQGRYDEGLEHAREAHSIGERCGESGITAKARTNLATIYDLRGDLERALELYCVGLDHPEQYDSPADHAASMSNTASLLHQFSRHEDAATLQLDAARKYEALARPFNVAIAWTSLAIHLQELGLHGYAWGALDRSDAAAAAAGYERGRAQIEVYRAESLAACGQNERAVASLRSGLARLSEFEVHDLSCLQIAARVARLGGDIDEARRAIRVALDATMQFPFMHASALMEASRVARAARDHDTAGDTLDRACVMFAQLGLNARAESVATEYGEPCEASQSVAEIVAGSIDECRNF